MAKKKIVKQSKQDLKPIKQDKVIEKSQKKTKKIQTNLDILTPKFFNRLDQFQTYYKEVVELKSKTNNTNINDQIQTVNQRVRAEFQNAQSTILQNQLQTLQKWISDQQSKLQTQISTVQRCYSENEKSLKLTGAFNDNEIKSQLKPIREKIEQKQKTYNDYGVLLTRSKVIYQSNKKEEMKEERHEDNGDNNDLDLNVDLE